MRRGTLMIMIVVLTLLPLAAFGGNLDSPAAPDAPGSAMYTLEDLYNRLDSGAEGAKRVGPFAEPGAGPASTGHSLDAVMAKAPQVDETDGAATAHVLVGKTFWGLLNGGGWGLLTGTMPTYSKTYTPGAGEQPIDTGYHEGSNVQGDSDLTPENIRAGVRIFDVDGSANCDDPDPNLTPENIACGVTIYGVTGTHGPRFQDNGDGTVTDNTTGLMWTKDANHGQKDWYAAKRYCQYLNFAGYRDWRLPTIDELKTLIDTRYRRPAVSNTCGIGKWREGDAFTGLQSYSYWSSTTLSLSSDLAWLGYLDYGDVHYDEKSSDLYYVWPVRGGL